MQKELFESNDIKVKLNELVKVAWKLVQKKIAKGYVKVNKEASLQLHYAYILQELISTFRFSDDEVVKVVLEDSVEMGPKKTQEIDIVVETKVENCPYRIAIEMKCYREFASSGDKRGALDIFMKDVYEDIESLEQYKLRCGVSKTFFLAMTDYRHFVHPKTKRGKCWEYDISQGFNLNGPKTIKTPVGGKNVSVTIMNSYKFDWTSEGDFYFLILE